VNVYLLGHLLEGYGSDAEITELLDAVEFTILPVFNVDGYAYTTAEDGDRMWRKTRSTYSSKLCVGVDPNRNWDWHWGEAGTSKNPCADDYQVRANGPPCAAQNALP
jgi:murein tripeptide amidase MpaA